MFIFKKECKSIVSVCKCKYAVYMKPRTYYSDKMCRFNVFLYTEILESALEWGATERLREELV